MNTFSGAYEPPLLPRAAAFMLYAAVSAVDDTR